MPTRTGGSSANQSLRSDFYQKQDATSKLMSNTGMDDINNLLAYDSSNRRLREGMRQAEIQSRDGNELEYLKTATVKEYVKERGLEGSLSPETKKMMKEFDERVSKGQTVDTGDGRALNFRVLARDLADNIKLDTRHFVDKTLTTLEGYKEDERRGYDPVESLSRFYLGSRVAIVATRDDGVKAVIMEENRGESKYRKGDFIAIDPANANQTAWSGTVQKVVTFSPVTAKGLMDDNVEWLVDRYPVTRSGKTVLDTTD